MVLLKASTFEVGLLTSAATAAFALIALPAGAIVDRHAKRGFSSPLREVCQDAHHWPPSWIWCEGLPASSATEMPRASAMATATDKTGCWSPAS